MTETWIWFDMDGTIYNLYQIPNWRELLQAKDASAFSIGKARKSLPQIRATIRFLQQEGYKVGIVTWAPMHITTSDKYFDEVAAVKIDWAEQNFPEVKRENILVLEYGAPKHVAVQLAVNTMVNDYCVTHILVDDNKEVRAEWRKEGRNFKTINAKRGYTTELAQLVI